MSVQDIRPNPQDTSNFYLANIYQSIADPNRPNISSPLPASPPQFPPPNYAVWVNALWFMSLVISLTCALLATLLQQWARRYLKVTQPHYSLHKRARIRAFFAEGVEKSFLPIVVEALPTLVHVSLVLFFAGLAVFLCNVNLTIFKLALSWVSICTALYGCITFLPVFRNDSPYNTPFSSPAWHVVTWISFAIIWWFTPSIRLLGGVFYYRFRLLKEIYRKMLVQGVQKTAEETALNLPSDIGARAFMWTFDSLDEDHELERFFSGLPGFRNSKVVDDPLPSLTSEQKKKLSTALVGLFDRTFLSDLVPEPVKYRRAIVCVKSLDLAEVPYATRQIVNRILFNDQCKVLRTAEFGNTVRGWDNSSGTQGTAAAVRAVVTGIVARAQRQDNSWFILASDELGISEAVLRDYAMHGDSLSLAVLNHVIRQHFIHYRMRSWPKDEFWQVLEAASKFNVKDTSPELQDEFCSLWNQIVIKAQNDNDQWMAWYILGPIRNVYIALHQDTDSAPTRFSASTTDYDRILKEPSSYPSCSVPSHHPQSTPHIRDVFVPTDLARVAQHDHENIALTPSFLASSPYTPSSTALRLDENHRDMSPLDNTSPNPAFARATYGSIGTSAERMRLSTRNPSASNPPTPMAPTSPPGAVAPQHIADRRASSNVLDVPSLPSLAPALDETHPADLQSSIISILTGSELASSSPDNHPSLLVPTTPGPSRPRLFSAQILVPTAEGEGSAKPALHKERDSLDSPSAIREYTMAAPDDLPQQSLSSSSITDVAIASPSWRSLGAEHADPLVPLSRRAP